MLEKIKDFLIKALAFIISLRNVQPFKFIADNKLISSIVAVCLALCLVLTIVLTSLPKQATESSSSSEIPVVNNISSEISSESSSSSLVSISSKESSSSKKPTSSKKQTATPAVTTPSYTTYNYNIFSDIENNVFMDSLVYTGYNIKKHRQDGLMWHYVLSSQKKGKGWLSKISYDYDGGTSGYETNANGLPDIAYFERGDMVCASYVTYVYFNYLPNVVGIDTSKLTKPNNPTLANDWHLCAKDWVKKGYSYEIPFTASRSGNGEIYFKPKTEIPIGSIILCNDMSNKTSQWACHVSIYAGYKNGYHWVYHVGNDNGPEFCAIERFCYGPDPVWPLRVISTPTNIRMSAAVEIELKDESGAPIANTEFKFKNKSNGKITSLGKTNSSGKISKEGINYGDYELTQTVLSGYTNKTPTISVKLTAKNNSLNKINIVNNKEKTSSNIQSSEK